MIALLVIVGLFVVMALVRGASLDVFWDWFIAGPGAPFHEHAPDLTLIQALGVSLVVSFLTYQFTSDDEDDVTEAVAKGVVKALGFYGIFWVSAIIYHSFMS